MTSKRAPVIGARGGGSGGPARSGRVPGRGRGGGGGGPSTVGRGGLGPGRLRLPGGAGGPARKRSPRKRGAAGLLVHGEWITGYNDEAQTCTATAIANSLLCVTGVRVTDDDVLLLFRQSGGGQGVSLADALDTLATRGIGGIRPVSFRRVEALGTGDVVGVAGTHAACYTDYGLISWGDVLPDDWEPDGEAWRIDWAA